MKSGETRRARTRAGDHDQTQGSLDGILASDEPQVPKRKQPRKRVETAGEIGVETLKSSLDTLEENIKLLLARHERLAAAHAASEELSRSRRALDPIQLLRVVCGRSRRTGNDSSGMRLSSRNGSVDCCREYAT